ncbi:type VII secretion protein EccB [Gordonia humi]|uniref:Type VII secretion protein EccB n=1 Tax=Gordonia humi TaxID=686429 RepID=A0A840FAU6_9ACTN|nr:type VII secretion protein EccB [Gordonia humi]MBB4137270.1 type VII secretion protein EccB [Gordonia humi]
MPRHITTRAQVSGYRFGLARAEHALVRRDERMLHDPMRAQNRALVAGAVVAVLILAGAGVYGLIRPAPSVGDARIVADSGGGLYVLVDEVMHPVLNLASARLIVGGPLPTKKVSDASLREHPRGPTLGIAGAPTSLPESAGDAVSSWTVCDGPAGTTVLAGRSPGPAASDAGALVTYDDEVWLLYTERGDGTPVRAEVDVAAVEVVRALGIEGARPRPVSAALLDAFPEREPLVVPGVPGRGGRGPLDLPVGTVIRTVAVDGAASYRVILADGVQQIPATAADLLRAADPDASAEVEEVAPGELTRTPVVDRLPVGHFPVRAPTLVDDAAVLCRHWSRGRDDAAARESIVVGDRLPLPADAVPVTLGSADGAGPGVDEVFLAPGTVEHVAVTGARGDSALAGQQFVVADTGVRHRLAGDDAASSLGFDDTPVRAPWSVISLLPEGPELSRAAALTMRDVVR